MEKLLNEREAAELLGISPRTLEATRSRGDGPKFVKVTRHRIAYKPSELRAWVEAHTRTSTSQGA
jgi:predicted DNA-binding transcriptional regulator AlpA